MASRVSQKVAVSVVYVAAMFMPIMDATIVNVALPTIGRDFRVSPEATGRASTMFNVIRQLGSAVGVAVFTTAIVAVGATKVAAGRVTPNLAAYHLAFLVAAGLALAGAIVALTIHDADAASTMVQRGGRKAQLGRAGAVPGASGPPEPRPS